MTNIKTVIVDDEPKSIQMLSLLLGYYPARIEVLGTAGSVASGLEVVQQFRDEIDMLFLDIRMPDGDGFMLLQQVPAPPFKVIFTTAYDAYALKAIKFSAFDYLLKPIDYKELLSTLDKFCKARPGETSLPVLKPAIQQVSLPDKLAIPTVNDILFVRLTAILYMKSENNYTTLFLDDGRQLLSSRNIGYFEELLQESHFFRVHNSYLVNLDKVARFIKSKTGTIEVEGGAIIQVSMRRKDGFLERLGYRL